jgi:hypothetical protein
MLHGELLVDQRPERRIERHGVEREEADVQLPAERLAQALLGDVPQPEQRRAQAAATLSLARQGLLQLRARDVPAFHQHRAQARAAPMALEHAHELITRDEPLRDEDLAEWRVPFQRGLHAHRLGHLARAHEPLGDEQVAQALGDRDTLAVQVGRWMGAGAVQLVWPVDGLRDLGVHGPGRVATDVPSPHARGHQDSTKISGTSSRRRRRREDGATTYYPQRGQKDQKLDGV